MITLEEIAARCAPEPNSGCLMWLGSTHPKRGYGRLKTDGVQWYVHRLVWVLCNGAIPPGLDVLHRCDVTCCCEPNHLFVGTHQDNMDDMAAKGRRKSNPNPRRGEDVNTAKLTADQVVAIRADPRLHREIAADYGVSRVHIGLIKRRMKWCHID